MSSAPNTDPHLHEPAVDALARLLRSRQPAAVLTGAGVSTESGLPDYRGASGLWRNRRFEQLASIEAFERDPAEFWQFYRERLDQLRQARPSEAHIALAALERAGLIEPVITQNVDGLHRAAGSQSVEVHGSLDRARCLQCDRTVTSDELPARMAAHAEQVPLCDCGRPLKPDVVLFGELLPVAQIEAAAHIVERCRMLLVCGSSLAVMPVSGFPIHVAMRGHPLAIVNQGPTEADTLADLRIDGRAGPVLAAVAERLLGAGWRR